MAPRSLPVYSVADPSKIQYTTVVSDSYGTLFSLSWKTDVRLVYVDGFAKGVTVGSRVQAGEAFRIR